MTRQHAIERLTGALTLSWDSAFGSLPALVLMLLGTSIIIGAWLPRSRQLLIAVVVPAMALCAAGRFVPPSRVWIYALPLVALVSAAGLVQIASRIPRLSPQKLTPWIAVGASLFLAVQLTMARNANPEFERRFYEQVEEMAAVISPRLNESAVLVAPLPMLHPLQYSLIRFGHHRDAVVGARHFSNSHRLASQNTVWLIRTRPDVPHDHWLTNTDRTYLDLDRPAFSEFSSPQLVKSTELLQLWTAKRR